MEAALALDLQLGCHNTHSLALGVTLGVTPGCHNAISVTLLLTIGLTLGVTHSSDPVKITIRPSVVRPVLNSIVTGY